MATVPGIDFTIDKQDRYKTYLLDTEVETDLRPGQVLFRVDRFAFTANNISYVMMGDMLKYWHFFPAAAGQGRIPTMGFGDVIASTHDGVGVGTRCFGFYPMSKHLLIEPASASPTSIIDGVPHRAELAVAYNQYQPSTGDAGYSAEYEDELLLLRGLFLTSFLAEDYLSDADLFGAESLVISSASSKTSIALAFVAAQRGRVRTVGLTSERNRDFVAGLGIYDRVVTYDAITDLDGKVPSIYVDMAGNPQITHDVHAHFGANLKFSQAIGGTHWDAERDAAAIPGPKPEFFFAPSQIAKRAGDWGPEEFQRRLGAALMTFLKSSRDWLQVRRSYGGEATKRVYAETLAGNVDPATGNIVSLWEDANAAGGRD